MSAKIIVRRPALHIPDDTPVVWLPDQPLMAFALNAFSCLGPFERMSITIFRGVLPNIRDPELRERVTAFNGQEHEHLRFHHEETLRLERRGLRAREKERLMERALLRVVLPGLSPPLRLAWVAGFEHLTLTLAELGLARDWMWPGQSALGDLILWHAAEEVEHRSVAHDVLRDQGVGYLHRVLGMVMASSLAMACLYFFAFKLSWEAGYGRRPSFYLRLFWITVMPGGFPATFLRSTLRFLRPSYDPRDCTFVEAAERVLARYEEAEVESRELSTAI